VKDRKPREPRENREKRERREPREPREKQAEEEKKPEPVEEEEVGFTLDDYMAAKQAKSQGLCKKADVRQHEKLDTKNIKEFEKKDDAIIAGHSDYTTQDLHKVTKGTGAELFGFQGEADEGEFRGTRGGRGGRGGY
jgi:hypothetical protein